MKKSSLAVALPALALTGLLLSGCGMFRSREGVAERQAAIAAANPAGPGYAHRPRAALVIPPPGSNQPSPNGATARVGSTPGMITDGFIMADSVDDTYRRVGEALEQWRYWYAAGP